MLIMLGATATFTFSHCSAFASPNVVSIAVFSTSMPVGWFTSSEPKYCAFSTFFGSSIGVGNDCAVSATTTTMNEGKIDNDVWIIINNFIFSYGKFHLLRSNFIFNELMFVQSICNAIEQTANKFEWNICLLDKAREREVEMNECQKVEMKGARNE